jgi:hypothetical protein
MKENKTILTFKKDITSKTHNYLSITESFNRKRNWLNHGLGTSISFSFDNLAFPINSHHKNKCPLVIEYLEQKPFHVSVYTRNYSHLRHVFRKERPLRGNIDLATRFIGIDVFNNSFKAIQNGLDNYNRFWLKLQFNDNDLLGVENKFMNKHYPHAETDSRNDDFYINSNFVVFDFSI